LTLASARQLLDCGHNQSVPALYVAEIGSTTICLTCEAVAVIVGLMWVGPRPDSSRDGARRASRSG
jgi:hypothetical protein